MKAVDPVEALFRDWMQALAVELERQLGFESGAGLQYIVDTGEECWREMFDDGLSPADAAFEEASAANP